MDVLNKNMRIQKRILNQRNFVHKNTNIPVRWATTTDLILSFLTVCEKERHNVVLLDRNKNIIFLVLFLFFETGSLFP